MKINLGCGKRNFGKDWIHIDGGDYEHLHSKDIRKLPLEDGVADLIYASHVIEYFDREEIVPILKEWHRVLKPDGILRLAVPDFAVMAKLYETNHSHCDDHSQAYLPHMDKNNGILISLNVECAK